MMKRISALILALMMVCLAAFAAAEVAAPKEDAQAEDFAGAWVCSYVVTHDGKKLDAATNLEVMNTQEVPTLTIEGNFAAFAGFAEMGTDPVPLTFADGAFAFEPEANVRIFTLRYLEDGALSLTFDMVQFAPTFYFIPAE